MKKLLINIKLTYYNFKLILEDLLDRLQGRKAYTSIEDTREVVEITSQNHKLRRGIEKLTRAIYDPETGLLRGYAKDPNGDLITLVGESENSTYEKIQRATITSRVLTNPTDESQTDLAIVKHNVKNAPRYELERQRRELTKQRMKAMTTNDVKTVTSLTKDIDLLTLQINQLKKQG